MNQADLLMRVLTAHGQRLAFRASVKGDPTHVVANLDANPLAQALCGVNQGYGWQPVHNLPLAAALPFAFCGTCLFRAFGEYVQEQETKHG